MDASDNVMNPRGVLWVKKINEQLDELQNERSVKMETMANDFLAWLHRVPTDLEDMHENRELSRATTTIGQVQEQTTDQLRVQENEQGVSAKDVELSKDERPDAHTLERKEAMQVNGAVMQHEQPQPALQLAQQDTTHDGDNDLIDADPSQPYNLRHQQRKSLPAYIIPKSRGRGRGRGGTQRGSSLDGHVTPSKQSTRGKRGGRGGRGRGRGAQRASHIPVVANREDSDDTRRAARSMPALSSRPQIEDTAMHRKNDDEPTATTKEVTKIDARQPLQEHKQQHAPPSPPAQRQMSFIQLDDSKGDNAKEKTNDVLLVSRTSQHDTFDDFLADDTSDLTSVNSSFLSMAFGSSILDNAHNHPSPAQASQLRRATLEPRQRRLPAITRVSRLSTSTLKTIPTDPKASFVHKESPQATLTVPPRRLTNIPVPKGAMERLRTSDASVSSYATANDDSHDAESVSMQDDSSIVERAVTPEWAKEQNLKRHLAEQQHIDAGQVFGQFKPVTVAQLTNTNPTTMTQKQK
ncbi:hypothetical protein BC940DRAFT_368016 [Gongronella butleri]|nr:hypothetical protein BC940DRAFT_368016 [Gongronella butleri]